MQCHLCHSTEDLISTRDGHHLCMECIRTGNAQIFLPSTLTFYFQRKFLESYLPERAKSLSEKDFEALVLEIRDLLDDGITEMLVEDLSQNRQEYEDAVKKLLDKTTVEVKAGKYKVCAEAGKRLYPYVEIYARDEEGRKYNLIRSGYILSKVIIPAIGKDLALEVIREGKEEIITSEENVSKILEKFRELKGDPILEAQLEEELGKANKNSKGIDNSL